MAKITVKEPYPPVVLESVENSSIDPDLLADIAANTFERDETQVKWADHLDSMAYIPGTILRSLLCLLLLAGTIWLSRLGAIHYQAHQRTDPGRMYSINLNPYLWLSCLFITLLSPFYPANKYIRGKALIRILTNKNIRVHFRPRQRWALWLWNDIDTEPQPLAGVDHVRVWKTLTGMIFGYEIIFPVVNLQSDEKFNAYLHKPWRFTRHGGRVAKWIMDVKGEPERKRKERVKKDSATLARIEANTRASRQNPPLEQLPTTPPGE